MTSSREFEDLLDYLANEPEKNNLENDSDNINIDSNLDFIELQSNTNGRGLGCESMNKCSGRGSCRNGACLCDEGYDYFDCSINVLSKYVFIFRKMS
jgi:hypothetical protein